VFNQVAILEVERMRIALAIRLRNGETHVQLGVATIRSLSHRIQVSCLKSLVIGMFHRAGAVGKGKLPITPFHEHFAAALRSSFGRITSE
jgi:hypothetical protein